MAPRRKRITATGQHLRALRSAMGLDQKDLAALVFVSERTVSRWENGFMPTEAQGERILNVAQHRAPVLHDLLAEALGYELTDKRTPVAVASPQRTSAELRASLDAIVYAASEERDLLPRHLRAFGVELLQGVARLGLSAKEAAELVAVRERTKVKSESTSGSAGTNN
jgi:transcriptional regulator with XRE-family HTH domain